LSGLLGYEALQGLKNTLFGKGSQAKNSRQFVDLKLMEIGPYPKLANLPKFLQKWFVYQGLSSSWKFKENSEAVEKP
jgi:hypothetical protein